MNTVIQVCVRNVYGNQLVYPANELGEQFAELLRVKSFSYLQRTQIEQMGFSFELVTDPRIKL